ncbi:MAG: HAAS signaling domain-containing protein [Pseudonocardia sp.]
MARAGTRTPTALDAYLQEVERHAYVLPRDSRHDLRSRVWTHCAEQAGRGADDERIRAVLAGLGTPEELVAAELQRCGARPNPFRARDIVPLHLLGASLFMVGLGAPLGLALLWRSRVWPRAHKIVASALVVGGTPALLWVEALRPGWALYLGPTVVGAAAAALYLLVIRLLARPTRSRTHPQGEADPPPTEGGSASPADQTSDR